MASSHDPCEFILIDSIIVAFLEGVRSEEEVTRVVQELAPAPVRTDPSI